MEKLKEEITSVVKIYESRDFDKAKAACKKLIENNPKVAFLYNLLGLILVEEKKIDEAISSFKEGLKIDPNYAMIYNNMGLLFVNEKTIRNKIKAETYYKKAISLDKNIAEPHNNLGSLYNSLEKYNEAIKSYKKAIEINSKFSYSYYNLGSLYITTGQFNDAKINLKEAIKLNPNFYEAHRALSRITKYTSDEEHFNILKNLYKNFKSNNLEHKINLSFSLGKAYEDLEDFDKSFDHYQEANKLFKNKIKFSLKEEKLKFQEIKDTYNLKLLDKFKNSGYQESSPIFIVGMPRSGTTLVEQILSSHAKVFGADEVEFIPELIKKNFGNHNIRLFFEGIMNFKKENLKNIGLDYTKKMNQISQNKEFATDKLPINFLYIGLIKMILPNSKIIHCQRNPKDNILSIFKNHFPSQKLNFAYDLKDIVEYYNLYAALMNYWNSLFTNFIFNIEYEKLILNTKDEVTKLLKFCNLEWSEDCLNFHNNKRPIKTASNSQARSKIYNKSIDSWKRYEKYLKDHFSNIKV
tara:strand:+ start:123 stop:1691 length:1569 start_codon:yes stop_codon:yes gene_type:complete